MDEEDRKVQDAILDHDPSRSHTVVLNMSLSCSYPNLPFDKALQKENEKLQLELQQSRTLDPAQRKVIQHLIGLTSVPNTLTGESNSVKNSRKLDPSHSDDQNDNGCAFNGKYLSQQRDPRSRYVLPPPPPPPLESINIFTCNGQFNGSHS